MDELAARYPEQDDLRILWTVRMFIEAGRLEDAEALLAPYLDMDCPPEWVAQAIWALLDAKGDGEQKRRFADPYFLELWFKQAFEGKFQDLLERGEAKELLELIQSYLNSFAEQNAPEAPLPADFLLWKARALKQLGRLPEALEVLQSLEQRQALNTPLVVAVYSLKGEVLQESQDLKGAEAAFLKGIEIDPWNAESYLGLRAIAL